MTNDKPPILVFGATGRQGGAVARALRQAQWSVRALVRDTAAPRSIALNDAGVELAQGSLEDIEAIRAAMKGVHGVFSVLPGNLGQEEEVRAGISIADIAVERGVRHFVYSSGASAGDRLTGVARFDAKPRIEAHVRSLPITATIIRPMIFMEMLARPGFGLEEGRYSFFLRPDQAMQLIAVSDIGKFVAAVFADRSQFGGETLKIAGDTVTGSDLEAVLTQVAGRPIAYARFSEETLMANPDLGHMAASLATGPLADHVDLDVMRQINPEIISFRSWLSGDGLSAFEEALGQGAA